MPSKNKRRAGEGIEWLWLLGAIGVATLLSLYFALKPSVINGSEATAITVDSQVFSGLVVNAVAIVFAFTFAKARYWPSMSQAVSLTGADIWVVLTAAGLILSAINHLMHNRYLTAFAASYWLISSLFGILVLVRTVILANTFTLNKRMSRVIAKRVKSRLNIPRNYFLAVDEALIESNELALRDYIDQLARAQRDERVDRHPMVILDAQQILFKKLFRGLVLNQASNDFISYALERLIEPALIQRAIDERDNADARIGQGLESYTLAIRSFEKTLDVISKSFDLTVRNLAEGKYDAQISHTARERIVVARARFSYWFDPEPKVVRNEDFDALTDLSPEVAVMFWRVLTRHALPGAQDEVYPLYQRLLKQRYHGNYWTGGEIVGEIALSSSVSGSLDSVRRESLIRQVDIGLAESLLRCFYLKKHAGVALWGVDGESLNTMCAAYLRISASAPPVEPHRALEGWIKSRLASRFDYDSLGDADEFANYDLIFSGLCVVQLVRACKKSEREFIAVWHSLAGFVAEDVFKFVIEILSVLSGVCELDSKDHPSTSDPESDRSAPDAGVSIFFSLCEQLGVDV